MIVLFSYVCLCVFITKILKILLEVDPHDREDVVFIFMYIYLNICIIFQIPKFYSLFVLFNFFLTLDILVCPNHCTESQIQQIQHICVAFPSILAF